MFDIQSGPVGILCCQSQVKKSAARSPRPRNPPKGFTLWNHPMGFCCPPGSKTLSHYQLFNSTMVHLHQNIENHMWENPKSTSKNWEHLFFMDFGRCIRQPHSRFPRACSGSSIAEALCRLQRMIFTSISLTVECWLLSVSTISYWWLLLVALGCKKNIYIYI